MPEASTRKPTVHGTATEGTNDPRQVSRQVREMFTSIAPRYDLLNHLLSANVDKLWWRRTAKTCAGVLAQSGIQVLDLCCGTGDMAFALSKQGPNARITGADFSHAMLTLATAKSAGRQLHWVEADALQLPFADECFHLVTSAFGFRNLADYDAGLREILRVLRPGGQVRLLEFNEPRGWLGRVYKVYFRHILPRIGRVVSGSPGAYSYLPASVARFPSPDELLDRMKAVGFREVFWTPYTFGIAGLFRGRR